MNNKTILRSSPHGNSLHFKKVIPVFKSDIQNISHSDGTERVKSLDEIKRDEIKKRMNSSSRAMKNRLSPRGQTIKTLPKNVKPNPKVKPTHISTVEPKKMLSIISEETESVSGSTMQNNFFSGSKSSDRDTKDSQLRSQYNGLNIVGIPRRLPTVYIPSTEISNKKILKASQFTTTTNNSRSISSLGSARSSTNMVQPKQILIPQGNHVTVNAGAQYIEKQSNKKCCENFTCTLI